MFDASDLPKCSEADLFEALDHCDEVEGPPNDPWRLALRAELAERGFDFGRGRAHSRAN